MTTSIWHDRLYCRHRIDGVLTLASPLRISSGVADEETDAPFIKNAAGMPYIPGTSLRGAVRAALERVVCGVGADICGIHACTLFSENDCARINRKKIGDTNEIQEEKTRNASMKALIENNVCDLCRLFGNTMFASRLVFEDCDVEALKGHLRLRDGVGIDRDTGAAVSGAKYDYQVLDPGGQKADFAFSVTVENAGPTDRLIVGLMLRLLAEGLWLGGKRAGGMGLVKLDPGSIQVSGFETPEEAWERITKVGVALMKPFEQSWEEVFPC